MKHKSKIIINIIIVLIITIIVSFFSMKNGLIDQHEEVEMRQSQIETVLQKRSDLISFFVATVKEYVPHKNEVFTSIAESRIKLAEGINNKNFSSIIEANASLDSYLYKLIALAEDYPELKTSEPFIVLQDELARTENMISVARQQYNEKIKNYNTAVQQFPLNVVANINGFYPMEYFEADDRAYEIPKIGFY